MWLESTKRTRSRSTGDLEKHLAWAWTCLAWLTHTHNNKKKKKKKVDSTPHCSRVVPHPSTKRAQTALTSVFG